MNAKALALTGALILIPAATLAQTAPPPTPSAPPPVYLGGSTNQRLPGAASNGNDMFASEINRRNLDDRARLTLQNTSPARMGRAERVAELINAGDCAGAQQLAVQENDRRLAQRVGEICAAEN